APHLSEELWSKLGHKESISLSKYPKYNNKFLDEDEFEYPIMINGKLRTKIKFSLEANGDEVKKQVVQNDIVLKWIKNENVKKIIFVPKKIINIVI
ncbi:MAG: class I tRNA ligase family protein, partial [Bacteroidota bacterium]|nr:class I tRNA ligase family protein [Bacteroidota bacterium]